MGPLRSSSGTKQQPKRKANSTMAPRNKARPSQYNLWRFLPPSTQFRSRVMTRILLRSCCWLFTVKSACLPPASTMPFSSSLVRSSGRCWASRFFLGGNFRSISFRARRNPRFRPLSGCSSSRPFSAMKRIQENVRSAVRRSTMTLPDGRAFARSEFFVAPGCITISFRNRGSAMIV